MTIEVKRIHLTYDENGQEKDLEGFLFLPDHFDNKSLGIFTHGYTSHKISILSWGTRLCESGMACIVFDLPGHYLGTFNDIESFDHFKVVAPNLFVSAYNLLELAIDEKSNESLDQWSLVLGGHSLGALISLKACELPELNRNLSQTLVCVGFGLPPEGVTHVFDTPLYKATLEVRKQFVSDALNPDTILPWIKEQKEQLTLQNKKVILLTGQDDVVVGKGGMELLAAQLEEQGNEVIVEKPLKLAHHMPETAAPHLRKILRDHELIS